MRWRRTQSERAPRPKVHPLSAEEKQNHLASMTNAIASSPVLTGFGVGVRFLRGRFYVERPTATSALVWGRITPVDEELLLEVEHRSWNEVARGTPKDLIDIIAGDTQGTFHGLGALDRSLRQAGQGLTRLPMKWEEKRFLYADSGKKGTVQEILFHFFGLPIEVIARPRQWYSYHRTPHIAEFAEDRTRVLVRFSASSMWGSFDGTCLYAQRGVSWGAYPIRPSESGSIATAEAWLVKRKWKAWD
jgi:hypothetical protein